MVTEKRSGQDRRSSSKNQIETLVNTRTGALALYADLAGRRPFSEEQTTVNALQRFCQALIDYTASAHFQLYRYLEENQERRTPVVQVAEETYPRILETTDAIVRFNDKYEKLEIRGHSEELADDLSRLGEVLADRIQLEDQVIAAFTQDRRSGAAAARNA